MATTAKNENSGLQIFLTGFEKLTQLIFEKVAALFSSKDRQDAYQVRKNALEIRMIRAKGYLELGS